MFPIQDSVPRRAVPVVTHALILINALFFFFELMLPPQGVEQLFYLFGIVPARFTHPDWAAYLGFLRTATGRSSRTNSCMAAGSIS
jgi:membrane associated rhomboid family serine protease